MKKSTLFFTLFISIIALSVGCQKDTAYTREALPPNLPETTFDYKQLNAAPGTISPIVLDEIDNEMATLGRVLFYDRHLSQNNSTSCGSCHKQHLAFADGERFSTGLHGKTTTRNSMSVVNAIFQNQFFWDNRANNLQKQVMMPIENHIEMGVSMLSTLPAKLEELSYYPTLFEDAFGTAEITEDRISKALAMFLKSMVSTNSKFDQGRLTSHSNLNAKEMLGKELFEGKALCRNCHSSNIFSGWGVANIGLDIEYEDQRFRFGYFKSPALKNIALTAPYMHDGRFNTLEEVVDHYNEGIKNHPFLAWQLRSFNGAVRLGLTELEKNALVAFLETLTDESFLSDERYSDPF